MGWPYFNKHLWLATPDNGLCAAIFSASEVSAQVGDGANVRITEDTHYPFEEKMRFTLHTDKAVIVSALSAHSRLVQDRRAFR